MLRYSGNLKYNDNQADLYFQIGTLLGAVRYRFKLNDEAVSGIYVFGFKIRHKNDEEREKPEEEQGDESKEVKEKTKEETNEETKEAVRKETLNGETEESQNSEGRSGKLLDKVKKLTSRVGEMLKNESVINCKDLFLEVAVKLLRHVFPRKISGYLIYGFDDPSLTGKILGFLAALYPLTKGNFEVTPEWNKSIIDTEIDFKGRIHLTYVIYLAAKVWFNKDFQTLRRKSNGRNS